MSTTTTTASYRIDDPTTVKLVAWGVTVWLAITLTFRLIGHVALDPSNTLLLTGFFVAVIPLMAAVTYPVYRYLQLPTPPAPPQPPRCPSPACSSTFFCSATPARRSPP